MTSLSELEQLLKEFKEARSKLHSASAERNKLEALGGVVKRKEREIRQKMGDRFDQDEFTSQYNSIPEEQEINRIHEQERRSMQAVQSIRLSLYAALDSLRSPKTDSAFRALDLIATVPIKETTDRYIALAESILRISRSKRSRHTSTASERDMEGVEVFVKQLAEEKFSHVEICERLSGMPRPPRAKWRFLSWPEAFKKHPQLVKSWLSKTIHK
jgi:hypothetical protein